jgi:hypothetical protein
MKIRAAAAKAGHEYHATITRSTLESGARPISKNQPGPVPIERLVISARSDHPQVPGVVQQAVGFIRQKVWSPSAPMSGMIWQA